MWLQALARETDIGAPEPIPARNGQFLVEVAGPGIQGSYHCLIMSWIPSLCGGHRNAPHNQPAHKNENASSFTPPHFSRDLSESITTLCSDAGPADGTHSKPGSHARRPAAREALLLLTEKAPLLRECTSLHQSRQIDPHT